MAKRIRIILILVSMCIIGLVIFKIVRVNAQFKDIKQITVYDKAQEIELEDIHIIRRSLNYIRRMNLLSGRG